MRGLYSGGRLRQLVLMGAQGGQESCNCPCVNGPGGQGDACDEVWGEVGGDQDGGGIEQDDVAAGAAFACEDGGEDGRVGVGVASDEGFDGGAFEAGVLGREGAEGDDAVVDLGEVGWAADGDLVEGADGAIGSFGGSVDDEGVAGAEEGHGFGDEGNGVGRVDSHDLRGGSGGVGEGAEEVEDGPDAEGSANGHDGLHGLVQTGGVEEGKAMVAEGGGGFDGGDVNGDAEGFENVGGAAPGGDGAVAVLGDGGSCGGGYESGGGGDVEGVAAVSAGAAGVDEEGLLCWREGDGSDDGAHGIDEACDLGGGFATCGQSTEEGGDFDVGELAGEDLLHEGAGLLAGEGRAAFDKVLEVRLEGHFFKRSRWSKG
ncbi:MAG: hypothetical protein JWQ42_5027 [Edaphobacter sp.]|nr:hypothetical protein [Edaphobacter sp.]